ncbi:N-formylglutamate amidohydrolase [Erythrobacteraceae bacterium CFH 75059]|uniref:N-formylglutamate amidohydrolase n=1 Tax=Qipengyuania thermophila TaxID=2509361 RepID=UPI0010222C11|nr:N-formylglutamate amidohydrolase [Qipengyuania thermophila]TCD05416.1 N-formylglutamate amidohydrolase [Erythrobacteraceae bacterium CFH 75059]
MDPASPARNPEGSEPGGDIRALTGFAACGGGRIDASSAPAFVMHRPLAPRVPVLLSVPHAGRAYPRAVLDAMGDPAAVSAVLEDRLADRLAERVAIATGAGVIMARAPRAMIDLNRDPADLDWSLVADPSPARFHPAPVSRRAQTGLGVIPSRAASVGSIWRRTLPISEYHRRVEDIHAPYQAALSQHLAALCEHWGCALLIDLHSMPPLRPQAGRGSTPRFVIGDRFGRSCAAHLSATALRVLGRHQAVAHNLPYAGGYILDRQAAPRHGIHAVQVEVCRSLYLDQSLRELGTGADSVVRALEQLVLGLASALIASKDAPPSWTHAAAAE